MPPQRRKPLPPGIYERVYRSGRRAYWISFTDQLGARVRESAGNSLEGAVRLQAQRKNEVTAGSYDRKVGTGEQFLSSYADRWVALRRVDKVRTVEREKQILRDHVLPALGKMRLGEIRPKHVAELVRSLGADLAPKSVLNVHGVLSALLARARFDELVPDNPARGLPRGILPENRRKRQVSAWTRGELERWITPNADVPEDRTVAYAIAAFTGARVGEIAGLRWRDLDTDAKPLWRWALKTQYDGAPLKTDEPRDVPVHTELARILAAWKLEGWPRYARRRPEPTDFVVPREDGSVHSRQSLGAKAVRRHAVAVGVDSTGRDFHSFRRAFVTLARTDGARVDVLERVTHNAKGEQIDGYTYFGWAALCDAVSCVRLAPIKGAVVELRSRSRA